MDILVDIVCLCMLLIYGGMYVAVIYQMEYYSTLFGMFKDNPKFIYFYHIYDLTYVCQIHGNQIYE